MTAKTGKTGRNEPADASELVSKAQAGDQKAFMTLYQRHHSQVAAIAYRMTNGRGDVDDLVQDVFLQVHRSLHNFRGTAKFSTWLHRVSVNVVLMSLRRQRSRPVLVAEESGPEERDSARKPDDEVSRKRRAASFQKLLARLSEKKRTVFVLHELEGLPPTEIAKLVDCPVLTVRTRLFYARKELAKMLRQEPTLRGCYRSEEGEEDAEITS